MERQLAAEGPDALLERPELLERLLAVRTMLVPSEALFFYVVLRHALSAGGRVLLQTILARCRSRTEAAVTFLATLELVRRRQVTAEQDELFGPIVIENSPEPAP